MLQFKAVYLIFMNFLQKTLILILVFPFFLTGCSENIENSPKPKVTETSKENKKQTDENIPTEKKDSSLEKVEKKEDLLFDFFPKKIDEFNGTCEKKDLLFTCKYEKADKTASIEIIASLDDKSANLDSYPNDIIVTWENYYLKQFKRTYAWIPKKDFSALFFEPEFADSASDNAIVLRYFLEKFGFNAEKMEPYKTERTQLPLIYDDMMLRLGYGSSKLISGFYGKGHDENTFQFIGIDYLVLFGAKINLIERYMRKELYGKGVFAPASVDDFQIAWLTDENKNMVTLTISNKKSLDKNTQLADIKLKDFISKKDFNFFLNLFDYSGCDVDHPGKCKFQPDKVSPEMEKMLQTLETLAKKQSEIRAFNNKLSGRVYSLFSEIKTASRTSYDNKKFLYDASDSEFMNLKTLLEINYEDAPQPVNDICYAIAMSQGTDPSSGDDNTFIIASWQKAIPPKDHKEGHITVQGEYNEKRTPLSLSSSDFHCSNISATPRKLLSFLGGKGIGLYIDEKGIHEAFNDFSQKPNNPEITVKKGIRRIKSNK